MSDLIDLTRKIQRAVGEDDDGKFGPRTANAVWRALNKGLDIDPELSIKGVDGIDDRSLSVIQTLDPKAQSDFMRFLRLAKATAATLGCDYIFIGGNRTWEEQDALFAKGRTAPGEIVTKARGGYSMHNFGIAADAGVFIGGTYLDDGSTAQQELASKVHRAVSMNAAECGLEWGGNWKTIVDQPHYQIDMGGKTTAQLRKLYKEKGSVL
ncbi:M15 family metallopeptidase [Luteolibacter pohnpeiensis]|uniref:M15 family metallopeptidase n=1 Tax=Luteolibacter pohnpeiensis TaxID=454153 RepID=A0A934SAV8_9BACT|nr:M15 family metallopeptidase [Luteolibacter pohnpeiensis]MBK1884116.1 M15 family metallopeptidase [Luteolibacter pohnpeiensis]